MSSDKMTITLSLEVRSKLVNGSARSLDFMTGNREDLPLNACFAVIVQCGAARGCICASEIAVEQKLVEEAMLTHNFGVVRDLETAVAGKQ